jgi:hypothetical protein
MPTDVVMVPCIVQLRPDDPAVALTTQVAAPSAATIAAAVAAPSSASIITALRAEQVSSAWGVTSQPVGGSTITYPERRGVTAIGTRTAYFDTTGKMVGLSAVV